VILDKTKKLLEKLYIKGEMTIREIQELTGLSIEEIIFTIKDVETVIDCEMASDLIWYLSHYTDILKEDFSTNEYKLEILLNNEGSSDFVFIQGEYELTGYATPYYDGECELPIDGNSIYDKILNMSYDEYLDETIVISNIPKSFNTISELVNWYNKKYPKLVMSKIPTLLYWYTERLQEKMNDQNEENYDDSLNENFDQILDFYKKVKEGGKLRSSEEAMMRSFKKHVDKGGNAEDFVYDLDKDMEPDQREGQVFDYNIGGSNLKYTFSEEYEEDGDDHYFGEIKYRGQEYLGIIYTDKKGYVLGYDFYNTGDQDNRLQDMMEEEDLSDELTFFFQGEVIDNLRE